MQRYLYSRFFIISLCTVILLIFPAKAMIPSASNIPDYLESINEKQIKEKKFTHKFFLIPPTWLGIRIQTGTLQILENSVGHLYTYQSTSKIILNYVIVGFIASLMGVIAFYLTKKLPWHKLKKLDPSLYKLDSDLYPLRCFLGTTFFTGILLTYATSPKICIDENKRSTLDEIRKWENENDERKVLIWDPVSERWFHIIKPVINEIDKVNPAQAPNNIQKGISFLQLHSDKIGSIISILQKLLKQ